MGSLRGVKFARLDAVLRSQSLAQNSSHLWLNPEFSLKSQLTFGLPHGVFCNNLTLP